MPPAIGTGEPAPVHPSDPAARALAAYERRLAEWRIAPGYRLDGLARRELGDVAEPRDALATFSPAERAALEDDAAAWRRSLEPLPTAFELVGGSSLDTWEHLDTSNSNHDETPARAREDGPAPLGQASRRDPDDGRARERAARYDRAKAELRPAIYAAANALAAADPIAPGPAMLERMAERLGQCRDVRAFRDAGCGAVLVQPFSCDVRLCPDCERSRSAAYVRRVDALAGAMARPLSGTLTLPNVPAGWLGLGLDVLTDAWARIRRTALFAGGPCRNPHQDPDDRPDTAGAPLPHRERCRHAPHRTRDARACRSCGKRKASHAAAACRFDPKPCGCARCMRSGRGCRRCTHRPVAGGVASLEVTYNPERGDWHPHLHFVADAPFLPWRELRDAWRAATCDAWRAAMERGAENGRGAGYRRPEHRPRVKLGACRHLADAQGRPADRVCPAGHGWRAADAGETCPYQDRGMAGPCGARGELIAPDDRCRGASMVWVEDPTRRPGGDGSARDAIREAVKYATKGVIGKDGTLAAPIREAPELLAELLLVLRNRRLVQGWGSFHNVTDDPDDDRPETIALDVGELFPVRVPKVCPSCQQEGLWHHLGVRPRGECIPGPGARLYWKPPPGGPH